MLLNLQNSETDAKSIEDPDYILDIDFQSTTRIFLKISYGSANMAPGSFLKGSFLFAACVDQGIGMCHVIAPGLRCSRRELCGCHSPQKFVKERNPSFIEFQTGT